MGWGTLLPVLGSGIGLMLAAILAPMRMVFTGALVTRREYEDRMRDMRQANEAKDRLIEVQSAQLAEILSAVRKLADYARPSS